MSKSRSSCSVTASSIHFGKNQKIPRGKDSLVHPGQQRCGPHQHPGGQQHQARGEVTVKLADTTSLQPSQGAAWPVRSDDQRPRPLSAAGGKAECGRKNRAEEALENGGEPGCHRCLATTEKRVGKPLSMLRPNCLSLSTSRGLCQKVTRMGTGSVSCPVPSEATCPTGTSSVPQDFDTCLLN